MSNTVKVKVSDNHFRNTYSLGGKTVDDQEPTRVEVTPTVRNAVQAGNLVLVQGSLAPERDEKKFQGDEAGREEVEESDEGVGSLKDKTKKELKELCEEKDLKKSGNKDELVERLREETE